MGNTKWIFKVLAMGSVLMACSLFSITARATDYYVSNAGDDGHSGTDASQAWKTVEKVNNSNIQPGDTVHFKCGDTWREQIRVIRSGTSVNPIKYTSYGMGAKPLFLGSFSANDPSSWKYMGGNIWSLNVMTTNKTLSNMSLNLSGESNATLTQNGLDCNLQITNSGGANDTANSIRLSTSKFSIQKNKYYVIKFTASTQAGTCTIPSIEMRNESGSYYYGKFQKGSTLNIDTTAKNYKAYFKAIDTKDDAVISLNLGKIPLVNGSLTLNFSNIKVEEYNDLVPIKDVGNIILNNGDENCAVKKEKAECVSQQNEFWYDDANDNINFYSVGNPADKYQSIEIAIINNILEQWGSDVSVKYIIYDGLAFKYGGAHAMQISKSIHTVIQNCDISYIGGGYIFDGKNEYPCDTTANPPVKERYGNGIDIWNSDANITISGCNISQIYDSGLALELFDANKSQSNVDLEENKISNCEMSFEFINEGSGACLTGITFQNNTCRDAGFGWGHNQRPGVGRQMKRGAHLTGELIPPSGTTNTTNVSISNNIFINASEECINMFAPVDSSTGKYTCLSMNNNKYYQPYSVQPPNYVINQTPDGVKFAYLKNIGNWKYWYNAGDQNAYVSAMGVDLNPIFNYYLPAPTNVTAQCNNYNSLDVNFTWTGDVGERYALYKKHRESGASPEMIAVNLGSGDQYQITGGAAGGQQVIPICDGAYEYYVARVDSFNNRISDFKTLCLSIKYILGPTNFTLTGSSDLNCDFSWTGAGQRYGIFRKPTGSTNAPVKIAETTDTNITVHGAVGSYDYYVAEIDSSGYQISSNSNQITVVK
ncbi:MAG: hypothetical protein Q8942_05350 [Bacillota bacterium]|nr:hypothetical protein [Bacillota bacterium]